MFDGIDALAHGVGGRRGRPHLNPCGFMQHFGGEALDGLGKRCREHKGLALFRQHRQNALNVRQETHVEHPVRFIHYEYGQILETGVSSPDMVEQAAGRSHDNGAAVTQGSGLCLKTDAAKDARGAHAHGSRQRIEHRMDLLGQFAGGCQHEHARA